VVWVWIVEEDPHARFGNGKDDSQHWVICTRFAPGAFPLAQLHYQWIRPTPPSEERTSTAAGIGEGEAEDVQEGWSSPGEEGGVRNVRPSGVRPSDVRPNDVRQDDRESIRMAKRSRYLRTIQMIQVKGLFENTEAPPTSSLLSTNSTRSVSIGM